tara:strand:- start:1939 stop:3558 length:1620 start_codon:yes stop_codon:yes gene_type:complete
MASTYTPLGVELMATGENAGTWGTKTNANLNLVSQLTGGFAQVSIAGGAGTTALDIDDGALTGTAQQRMIEFTGSITGNRIVTIPNDVETFYILRNSTSGAYTVQFKYATGSGSTFTFSTTDKGDKILFASASPDATNPNILSLAIGTGISDVVDDTSPQLGGNLDTNDFNIAFDDAHGIIDENGNEQIIFQTTGSAVNQLDVTNAATGNPPKVSATGGDSNIDLDLEAKGTGHLTVRGNTNPGAIQLNCESNSHGQQIKSQPHSASVTNVMLLPAGADSTLVSLVSTDTLTNKTLTSPAIGTKISDTNGNELINLTATSSAVNEFTLANAATGNGPILSATGETNVDINLNPKGTGTLKSGSNAVKIAGKETMWVPAAAMYGPTTNPADAEQIETTALRPDMKVFDFDASTDQYTQFTVAMPKSWNEGTITYQVYWSPSTTNTGNCIFRLQGLSRVDNESIDTAYGSFTDVTDAGIGTVEDQQVSAESGAVTLTTPAADALSYFQFARRASNGGDTFTGEARVLGIKIFFTTDAANDA